MYLLESLDSLVIREQAALVILEFFIREFTLMKSLIF